MGKSDEEKRLAEYQAALDADDEEDAKKARLFDPADLLKSVRAIRQKKIPGLGLVNYGVLTFDEMIEAGKIEDKAEQAKTTLWMMLHKAHPDVKKEDIGKYPGKKVILLLKLLKDSNDNFLPEQKKSPSGSKSTVKRK